MLKDVRSEGRTRYICNLTPLDAHSGFSRSMKAWQSLKIILGL